MGRWLDSTWNTRDDWPTQWRASNPVRPAEELMEAIADVIVMRRTQTWRHYAACRDSDVSLFYPERGDHSTAADARQICQGCQVRQQCAETGERELWGVWGGTTATRRRPSNRGAA